MRILNDEQFLYFLLVQKNSQKTASLLKKILIHKVKFFKFNTYVRVMIPEYRNRFFLIPSITVNCELDEFMQQISVVKNKLECSIYKGNLYLLGKNNIININFFANDNEYRKQRLYFFYGAPINSIKNHKGFLNALKYTSTLLKICRLIFFKSNKYERASIRRKSASLIYKVLNNLQLRSYAENYRFYTISEEQFKNLLVYEGNYIERFIRKKQYMLVTDNLRYCKIGEIIDYLKDEDLDAIWKQKGEPVYRQKYSSIDRWLDMEFWNNGNSHFWGNVVYGFRRELSAYEDIDDEIDDYPFLSMAYFESKYSMDETEIADLLGKNPISLRERHITGGRHRVFAMIGRLIKNEKYIPFIVDRLK